VHVVDPRTRSDSVIYRGSPTWAIIAFASDGIYLARLTSAQYKIHKSGIFVMSTHGGSPKIVPGSDVQLDDGGWQVLNGGAAWGTRFSGPAGMGPGNELWRFDMKTGKAVRWFAAPAEFFLTIIGFDPAGNPLVVSELSSITEGQTQVAAILNVDRPEHVTQIYTSDGPGPIGSWVADSHGTWVGGAGTIWFYQSGSSILPVPVFKDQNTTVQVGGPCV
jgi:hypothetical protein